MTGIKYHGQQAFEAEFRTSSKQGGEQGSPAKVCDRLGGDCSAMIRMLTTKKT